MTFPEEQAKIVQSDIQFIPSYPSSPVVLCSCLVDRHPRVTNGRADSCADRGWNSAGQQMGSLHQHTVWSPQAWKLKRRKKKAAKDVFVSMIPVNKCTFCFSNRMQASC